MFALSRTPAEAEPAASELPPGTTDVEGWFRGINSMDEGMVALSRRDAISDPLLDAGGPNNRAIGQLPLSTGAITAKRFLGVALESTPSIASPMAAH